MGCVDTDSTLRQQEPRLIRKAKAFRKDADGSATIEFVIWLPLYVFILAMIADFSMVFMNQAKMWDAARDGARQIAFYRMTAEEAEQHVASTLQNTAPNIDVSASDGDEVVVHVSTPIADASPIGLISHLMSGTLVARVSMSKEPI